MGVFLWISVSFGRLLWKDLLNLPLLHGLENQCFIHCCLHGCMPVRYCLNNRCGIWILLTQQSEWVELKYEYFGDALYSLCYILNCCLTHWNRCYFTIDLQYQAARCFLLHLEHISKGSLSIQTFSLGTSRDVTDSITQPMPVTVLYVDIQAPNILLL